MKVAYVLPRRLELEIDQQRKASEDPELPTWGRDRAKRRIRQLEWRLRSERRYVVVNRWVRILALPAFVLYVLIRGFSNPEIPVPTRLSDLFPFVVAGFLVLIYQAFLWIWRVRMALGCPHDDDKELPATAAKRQ